MPLLVTCLGLFTATPGLHAQGYFRFQAGGAPTGVGSANAPLPEGNIDSQIFAGVDGLTLTQVYIPKPNHLGILTTRNIDGVPFLQSQDTACVRYGTGSPIRRLLILVHSHCQSAL